MADYHKILYNKISFGPTNILPITENNNRKFVIIGSKEKVLKLKTRDLKPETFNLNNEKKN